MPRDHTIGGLSKELKKYRRGEEIKAADILAMESSEALGGLASLIKAVNDVTADDGSAPCGKLFLIRDKTNDGNTTLIVQLRFGLPGV